MNKKTRKIMDYWESCAYKNSKADYAINTLLENFCKAKKVNYIPSDIFRTIDKLSIKNKICLLKIMEHTNIKDM